MTILKNQKLLSPTARSRSPSTPDVSVLGVDRGRTDDAGGFPTVVVAGGEGDDPRDVLPGLAWELEGESDV
jgi:hypothetical protein